MAIITKHKTQHHFSYVTFVFIVLFCATPSAFAQYTEHSGSFFPDGDIGTDARPTQKQQQPLKQPAALPREHTADLPAEPVQTAHVNATPKPIAQTLHPTATLSSTTVFKESQALHTAFEHEVSNAALPPALLQAIWITLARKQLEESQYHPDKSQVLVVVDRNPKVQRLALIVLNLNDQTWSTIGSTRISTGTKGRKHYYITPTGVFTNTSDRLGYRALGTKNKNGIMGNGSHGMRVWDFGWQQAAKGWLPSHEKGPIRLEMHATDPYMLEQRLGHVASAGCIRIPAPLNIFIDKHGLLDADYELKSHTDKRFLALLRKDRVPSSLSGIALVVIDSSVTLKHSPFTHTHNF